MGVGHSGDAIATAEQIVKDADKTRCSVLVSKITGINLFKKIKIYLK
jgi:serine kinase of HPr protein (carbohydrate metabolism regulator)